MPEGEWSNCTLCFRDSINPAYEEWRMTKYLLVLAWFRSGDCHDGMHYFGMNSTTQRFDESVSDRGLLVMNHEYINPTFLHPKGPTKVDGHWPEDEVIREVNAHGVSVIEIKKINSQ